MSQELRRISLMIREDQYQKLSEMGINLSGFIRDLIDDQLSDHKITLAVSEATAKIYTQVVSNSGATDVDVEKYLVRALKELLRERINSLQHLEKNLRQD